MFPIPFNFPFIKKDGTRTTIGAAMSEGGGGSYTLPTASPSTKGGVKIGTGLSMSGEVLNTNIPEITESDYGKVLAIDNTGNLVWANVSAGTNSFAIAASNIIRPIPTTNVEEGN